MDKSNHYSRQVLLQEIENIRHTMVITALKEGLNSINTLRLSEKLDCLLNELEQRV